MSYKANPTNITHEAETGIFEAEVTVECEALTTCHVVQVPGPISLPFDVLRPALIKAAIEQHRSGRFAFRIRREESPGETVHRELFSGSGLLDRFLGRAA